MCEEITTIRALTKALEHLDPADIEQATPTLPLTKLAQASMPLIEVAGPANSAAF